jgi:ferredoxin
MTIGRRRGRGGRGAGQGMGRRRGAGRGGRRGMGRRAGQPLDRNLHFGLVPGGMYFGASAGRAEAPRNKAQENKASLARTEAVKTMPPMPGDRIQKATPGIKKSIQRIAIIDEELCTGCGICADICREHAVVFMNANPMIHPHRCSGCGDCIDQCPNGAISLAELTRAAGS